MNFFAKIVLTLTLWGIYGVPVVSKEIFVSRHYGNNLSSCGETILAACKTIALAIAQAQWNDTIYLDGTETSRDPYPCLPMTSYTSGIYINKSLSWKRFGNADVFLNCTSSRQIVFDGSNTSETVLIKLQGLIFFNSTVVATRCSLYVNSCLFTNAVSFLYVTAVIKFEAFQGQFALTVQESVFSNNAFPCIFVIGNSPKIEVYDTTFINNTAIWESPKMVDAAVFMVLLTNQHTEYLSSVAFSNISFTKNMAPFGGCLHIQTISANSAEGHTIKGHKKDRSTIKKNFSITSQPYYTNHYTCQSTKEHISISISKGKFYHNVGGALAITVSRNVTFVNISITKSSFINNSSPLQGGAMLLESIGEFYVQIEACDFVENRARIEGSAISITAVTKTGSILVRNVLFKENTLHNPFHIDDVPIGGTLTLYVQQGYLKILLENVSFLYNKAAMGSSTLYSKGFIQEVMIAACKFLGNSQDVGFSYDWKTIYIDSYILNFVLIDTIVSENKAKPRADSTPLEGQPVHFYLAGFYLARINISGLQYKNNKGGGMYIQLGLSEESNSTFFLQDASFENNEVFSLEIKAETNTSLQIKRVLFAANSFVNSALQSLALFFLYVKAQGNQITMQHTTFENNTIQGTTVLIRLPPDEKDPNECKTPRWNYNNKVQLLKAVFRQNNANTSVMRLENGYNTLTNCQFIDNFAAYDIFISESSTSLSLVDTSFQQTRNRISAKTDLFPKLMWISAVFRGYIYYASSGPIVLKNTSLTVKLTQDIDAYFMVTGASRAHIDNLSVIQCPIGTLKTRTLFSHSQFVSNAVCGNSLYKTLSQSFIFSCKLCFTGFYSVEPVAKKCLPCPFGGNCTNNIAAKPTFWGYPSLSERGAINFQKCPIDYCCPYKNISCSYDNKHYLSTGCSGNRTGYLCGKCKPGFTETLFSARCRANHLCTDYWFWSVAFLYSLAFAFFLLRRDPIIRLIRRLLPWDKPTPGGHLGDDSSANSGGYVKIVFYFYQVVNLVFVSEDIKLHLAEKYLLTPILGWFDFKAISSNDGLVCPSSGLTVASKMFLQASQVFAVLLGVLVIFLSHGAVRKVKKQFPTMPSSGQYLGATAECLLLGYSALASAALKALNCVEIQSTSRFFYDGNVKCWQWWQKLCGVFLSVFIIPFVFVLYFGSNLLNRRAITTKRFLCACIFPLPFTIFWIATCRKDLNKTGDQDDQRVGSEQTPLIDPCLSTRPEQSSLQDPMDDVVYGPFKKCSDGQGSGAVYWESVLIGRRLVLICLHTFIVFPFVRMVCLSVTCAAILVHHIWKKPFQNPRVNHAETASLSALLVLAVINIAEVTLGMNGELLSKQERVCLSVLHVVEVIILGTVPLIFVVVVVVSVAWQFIKLCHFCLLHSFKLFIN